MAVNYLNLVRATVIGLLITPVLLNQLGDESFGVWSLAIGAVGYIGLVESGLSTALVVKVAAAEARGDFTEVAVLLATGRRLLLSFATLGMALIAGIAVAFNDMFAVPPGLAGAAQVALCLLGAATMVDVVASAWAAALVGTGRIDVVSLLGFVTTTVMAVGQMALAVAGGGIPLLAGVTLSTSLASLLVNRLLARRLLRHLPHARASRPAAVALLSLGGRNLLVSISGTVAFGSDVLIVGVVAGPRAAAAYAVASRAATFARTLATSASDVMMPTFSNAVARGDADRVGQLYQSAILLGLLVAVPVSIIFASFAAPLLTVWLGDTPRGAESVLIALGLLIVAQGPGHVALILLMGAQRSNVLLRFTLPAALLNLAVSVPASVWLGAIGPAIGSIVAALLVDPLLVRRAARDQAHMRARDVYWTIVKILAVPTVILSLGSLTIRTTVPVSPWLSLCLAAVIGFLFVLLSFIFIRWTGQGTFIAKALQPLPVLGGRLSHFIGGGSRKPAGTAIG